VLSALFEFFVRIGAGKWARGKGGADAITPVLPAIPRNVVLRVFQDSFRPSTVRHSIFGLTTAASYTILL
jgi:hypothetical protein